MKNYDPNIREGKHVLKATLQEWDYVGHIVYEMGGNCKGKTILDTFDFYSYDDVDTFINNDCKISFDEDYEIFKAILLNEEGEELEIEGDAKEFNNMIVAIEMLSYDAEDFEHED